MSSLRQEFPALYGFFACYFHQDWNLDDPDAEAVINRFCNDATSADEVDQVVGDLRRFLQMDLHEEQRDKILQYELLCNFSPTVHGLSCTEWLQWVRSKLESPECDGF